MTQDTLTLKYDCTNNGFCTVYYRCPERPRQLYAVIPMNGGWVLHTSTEDGEPSSPIYGSFIGDVELPPGDEWSDRELRAWLQAGNVLNAKYVMEG